MKKGGIKNWINLFNNIDKYSYFDREILSCLPGVPPEWVKGRSRIKTFGSFHKFFSSMVASLLWGLG